MIAAPTTAECMRYGGGWGTCVARPAPPPAWDATATQASLSLWIKASQWAFAATFGGVQVVNEWDDIPSNGDSYFEPIGGSAAIGPQWIPDDGTGKPCVRFRGNSGEGLRLVVGDVAPNLRIAANDDTFHVADRVLTLAMVAKVPLGGTNGAAIAGYYSPTQGAANIGVLQGYGWHTHPTDAYANPPVFTAYPGAGAADHFIASAPTALRGGTRVLYVGDVVFHRYDTGGGVYDINIDGYTNGEDQSTIQAYLGTDCRIAQSAGHGAAVRARNP